MKETVFGHIKTAYRGRKVWLNLVRKCKIGHNDCVILIPTHNREWNRLALKHLDAYLNRKYADRAIILSCDSWVASSIRDYSLKDNRVVEITREQAELLMQYYLLYVFFKNFIIISLNEPVGNEDIVLLGRNDVTVEDLICLGIYRLPEVSG